MSSQAEAEVLLTAAPSGLSEKVGPDSIPESEDRSRSSFSVAATPCVPAPPNSSITTRAGVYLGLRYGLGVLVSIGNMFLLTWWIGPHAYGIFITAIGLTAFLASLARSGVDTCLVRRAAPPDESLYAVANALIASLSLILMLAGAAAVPLLARWYGNREFVPAYTVLLFTIPLVGLTGPPTAKLERDLNFRIVAQIELGGQVLALLVSLTLAWRGLGVWAPVLGHLSWQIFGTSAAFVAAKLVPRFRFNRRHVREMLSFGAGYTASLRTWQLRTLVNPLLVGRFAGAEGVAFVGLAIRIAEGLGFIRIAAARLAIAALARLQQDEARFRTALQNALKLQVIVLGPLLCAFALVGPFVVGRFMGARWTPSLQVYPFIAAGVLINSIFNLQASALFVVGQQWLVLRSYASHVVLLIFGTWLLMPRLGISGYGWADLAACLGYWFLQSGRLPSTGISYRRLAPWVLGFLAPLFAPFVHHRWGLTLCLPLLALATYEEWRTGLRPLWTHEHSCKKIALTLFSKLLSGKIAHLATFACKARRRGWLYIYAVLLYQLRSRSYRAPLRLRGALRWAAEAARKPQSCSWPSSDHQVLTMPGRHPAFHFDVEDIPAIVASVPEPMRTSTLEEAGRLLSQDFRFRGRAFTFVGEVDWQAPPGGNISWEWDLNRHRYFVTLGTAYYYSRDPQYLDKLAALWEQWIAANPVCRTPAWQQPFEVASRLRNWMWAYFLLERSGKVHPALLDRLKTALRDHGDYLYSNLEYHWPNNHLLLEVKTLYEYALLFPELDRDGRITVRSRRVLVHEIESQILPDGGHAELCSMYHRIIAGELGELAVLCCRLGQPLSAQLEERIRKSVEFSRALLPESGNAPLLGDSAGDDTNLRFDFHASEPSELTYWIRWEEAGAPFPLAQRKACGRQPGAPSLQIFPDSGYAFLTAGNEDHRLHLTFDFGPFSQCASPNHAHADALSFALYAGGQPLLVDPGVYLPWHDDGSWALHFRSSTAHNTLRVDEKEQSELSRQADVGRTAMVRLIDYETSDREVQITAECVPYWSDRTQVCHRRTVSMRDDGRISVRDRVLGSGRHRLEWYFHAASQIDLSEACIGGFVLLAPQARKELARVHAHAPKIPPLKLVCGQTEPRQGWISLNSAEVLPAYVAIYSAEVELPFSIDFEIEMDAGSVSRETSHIRTVCLP